MASQARWVAQEGVNTKAWEQKAFRGYGESRVAFSRALKLGARLGRGAGREKV